jgi:DNA repair protein RadA
LGISKNNERDCSFGASVSRDTGQETNLNTTAAEYHRDTRNAIERISTGSLELDKLLGGGIETKAVTQFYGDSGSGKTLCHSLATMVSQHKSNGGVGGKCIYIDTEGSFRPDRVSVIANARGLNSDLVLENIIINQPLNWETQELVVERFIPKVLAQSTDKRIKLIIVDSPITHYKTEYTDLSKRSSRLQKLFRFMSSLRRIGQSYGLAIVVTNHASTIPDSNLVGDIFMKKPAGGNAIGYTSTYILYLRNGPQIGCKAVLVKCPFEPKGSAKFTIDETGVADFTD